MNLTNQDFVKGQDFTQFNPQTATQHNQLVDEATPWTDGSDDGQGIGLLLTTTDTDITGTPNVPYAGGTTKWKRYVWVRRPFQDPTVLNTSCQIYGWNDEAIDDPVFHKWQLIDPASYITLTEASKTVTDGATQNAKTTFTSVQANFTSADLGKLVSGPGIPAGTTIASLSTTPNTVNLSAKATSTNTNQSYTIQYNSTLPYRTVIDAVLTNQTITSATINFVTADVGMLITGDNIPAGTIIQSVQSSTNATMSQAAILNGANNTVSIAYKAGSPLNAAINYAVDTSNNAYSTAIAANNNAGALQAACLVSSPSVVSPPLETQINNNTAAINSANLNNNTIWNWISGDLTSISKATNSGTLNFRVSTLETSVLNLQTGTTDVSKLVPGSAGYSLRTNAAVTPAVVWYDPRAQDETMVVTATASSAGALSAFVVNGQSGSAPVIGAVTGTYLVQYWATCWGNYGGGGTNIQMRLNVGGQNVDSSIVNSGTNSTVPVTLVGVGYIKLSSGSGVALAGSMLQGSLLASGTLLFILRKVSPVST